MLKPLMSDLTRSFVARRPLRAALYLIRVLSLSGFLAVPAQVAAVESASGQDSSMLTVLVTVLLAALGLAALLIIGIVVWSRKQEHIGEMMLFCMKYLVHSTDEEERSASAKALGRANDPRALLVLVDVIWDEDEAEAVHKAASEALHEMSLHFRKQKKIIADLELESERKNFLGIIDILITNFEQGQKRYEQSAYVIGRHYMRLNRYADAREWLTKAEFRNRKSNLYGNRIKAMIQACNARLLEEADDSFKAADYQQAREHYAALDHGMSDADRRRCAIYLRSSCVYCKLKDYVNADQALVVALRYDHETDLALTLVPLLQKILIPGGRNVEPKQELEEIEVEIDERATAIMDSLLARDVWGQTAQSGS